MLLQQIQQLQKTVQQLQTGQQNQQQQQQQQQGYGQMGFYGQPGTQGYSNYQQGGGGGSWGAPGGGRGGSRPPLPKSEAPPGADEGVEEGQQVVLLVSNIPPNLANTDSLFYAFEKFGSVARVKILHNKRNTALIQMSCHAEAQRAIDEQEKLNRVGTEIYVNFSSKFREIKLPEPGSMYDDGLSKDFTGEFPSTGSSTGHGGGMGNPQSGFGIGGGGYDGGFNGGAGGFGNQGSGFGGQGFGRMGGGGGRGGYGADFGDMGRGGTGGPGGCVVLLISNIPEELSNVTNIFNMVGMYGDVVAVKILRNKTDCCLVQLAKPHHAQQVRNFLDQAKVGGKKLCVSNSRVEALLNNKRMPEDDPLQCDFSNSRNHRYRNHQMAAKLTKNLGPPSSTLHVANLPEDLTHVEVKDMFIERGFTVKESKECGAGGSMALLTMASPEEALRALAVMHNYAPEEYKFKNAAGLCVSFSSARKQFDS